MWRISGGSIELGCLSFVGGVLAFGYVYWEMIPG
jgi:hypothetical protein